MNVVDLTARTLDARERRFVQLVGSHLRDVPNRRRKELLAIVEANLADRPPSPDETSLWLSVGTPTDYARELRKEHDLGPERTDRYARWLAIDRRRRYLGTALAITLVTALVAAGLTLRWWLTWEAGLGLQVNNVCMDFQSKDCEIGVIRTDTLSGGREVVVDYRPGGSFDVLVSLGGPFDNPVRVTHVKLSGPSVSPYAAYTLSTVSSLEFVDRQPVVTPFEPTMLTPLGLQLILTVDFGPCSTNGWTTLSDLLVTYEALGRTRTERLPLGSTVAIQFPSACPPGTSLPPPEGGPWSVGTR